MGRVNMPRRSHSAPERSVPMGAYTAGFLAFLSTVYIVLNREPLTAVLMVGSLWVFFLLLRPLLSQGRWRIALEYFAALRAYERKAESARHPAEVKVAQPVVEEVDLSESEREQFARLMGEAGFGSNWPKP